MLEARKREEASVSVPSKGRKNGMGKEKACEKITGESEQLALIFVEIGTVKSRLAQSKSRS